MYIIIFRQYSPWHIGVEGVVLVDIIIVDWPQAVIIIRFAIFLKRGSPPPPPPPPPPKKKKKKKTQYCYLVIYSEPLIDSEKL